MKVLESPKPRAATILNRAAHALLRVGIRRLNPLMLSLAGSTRLPMLAVIYHRGRRSGRSYATPLGARPIANGFVIPITFGEQANWFRNVQAAGGCVIRWKGANYPLIDPEVVDWTTARSAFYPVERVLMPIIGVEQFVRLRHAPASSDVSHKEYQGRGRKGADLPHRQPARTANDERERVSALVPPPQQH